MEKMFTIDNVARCLGNCLQFSRGACFLMINGSWVFLAFHKVRKLCVEQCQGSFLVPPRRGIPFLELRARQRAKGSGLCGRL